MIWIIVFVEICVCLSSSGGNFGIPQVDLRTSVTTLTEGSDIKIICEGRNYPDHDTAEVTFNRLDEVGLPIDQINVSDDKYNTVRLPQKPIGERILIVELNIKDADYEDDGIYQCIIADGDSVASDTMSLLIEGSPVIEKYEDLGNSILTYSIHLTCNVRCYPAPDFMKWEDPYGSTIQNSVDFFIQHTKSLFSNNIEMTLTINSLSPDQLGQYKCIIGNAYGTANVTYNVTAHPSVEIIEPNKTDYKIGEPITIKCKVTNIPQPIEELSTVFAVSTLYHAFVWRFTSSPGIKPSTLNISPEKGQLFDIHFEVESEMVRYSILNIWKAEFEYQGKYICAHHLPKGQSEIRIGKPITVTDSPIVTTQSNSISALPSSNVEIMCNVTARPKATVVWFKNARQIELDSDKYQVENITDDIYITSILHINNISIEDYNVNFICEASNDISKKRVPITLQDENECGNNSTCNGKGSLCIDDLGSYHCECSPGYLMMNEHCVAKHLKGKSDQIDYTHIGIGVGTALVFSTVIVGAAILILRKRRDSFVKKMTPSFAARYNISRRNSAVSEGYENGGLEVDRDAFPRNRLKFTDHLGEGKFGRVYKAEALSICKSGKWETVAVKMWKDTSTDGEKEDFYHELMIIKKITHHPNVVSFLGTSKAQGSDSVLMIMEYVPSGDLLKFLRHNRTYYNQVELVNKTGDEHEESGEESRQHEPSQLNDSINGGLSGENSTSRPTEFPTFHPDLSAKDLLCFSHQIAKGLNHIASLKIVHRDVAARNVLVGENNICKVSDFGLARDIEGSDEYERTTKGPLPIRWMSIESLRDNVHSTKSDVWSYGICLWEIATFGASPYPGKSAKMAMECVLSGENLPCPSHCKQEFYAIMESCWAADPINRPSFEDLVHKLEELLEAEGEYMMLDCFDEGIYCVIDENPSDERL